MARLKADHVWLENRPDGSLVATIERYGRIYTDKDLRPILAGGEVVDWEEVQLEEPRRIRTRRKNTYYPTTSSILRLWRTLWDGGKWRYTGEWDLGQAFQPVQEEASRI